MEQAAQRLVSGAGAGSSVEAMETSGQFTEYQVAGEEPGEDDGDSGDEGVGVVGITQFGAGEE